MTTGVGGTDRVLLLGDGPGVEDLATRLEADGVTVLRASSAPQALATLGAVNVDLAVVAPDGPDPADFFGAAARLGHQVPGVVLSSEISSLPAGVEYAPTDPVAAASQVRQRLLASSAADAEPVAGEDPLAAYGATVAHELRNHLEAAGLAVENLEGDTKGHAEKALERLRDLATEAEAVAKGTVAETEAVDIASAAATAAERIPAKKASVNVRTNGAIEANESLVALMFENLFRNAVEHVGPDVDVEVFDTDEGFAVVDDGSGFEAEDPFEWGYTTGGGQGAGLAVVRRIADAHGWSVNASNDGGARIDVITN